MSSAVILSTVTQLQEGGTGGEVSEILFFSAKSKRRPSLIYSMQIIPVCLSIVARRKGVSATRRGGLNWTPISLLVGHPCKLFHKQSNRHQPAHPKIGQCIHGTSKRYGPFRGLPKFAGLARGVELQKYIQGLLALLAETINLNSAVGAEKNYDKLLMLTINLVWKFQKWLTFLVRRFR